MSKRIFLLFLFIQAFCKETSQESKLFELQATTTEPGWIPPARKYLTLRTDDNIDYMMKITAGATIPQDLWVLVHTGKPHLTFFVPPARFPNFDPTRSSTYQNDQIKGTFKMELDRDNFTLISPDIGQDQISILMSYIGLPATERIGAQVQILTGSNLNITAGFYTSPVTLLHTSSQYAGVMGLSYQDSGSNLDNAFLDLLLPESDTPFHPFFSLDLNDNTEESRLYIGGIEESYRDVLSWSAPVSNGDLHSFRIYDLTICDRNLFANPSTAEKQASDLSGLAKNGLIGVVDTGSACLGLPAEIYDMVVSWLPVACGLNSDSLPLDMTVCYENLRDIYYLDNTFATILPTLAFRVSKTGPYLYINVSDLILPTRDFNPGVPWRARALCLVRGNKVGNGATITFGSRVLRSLFASFSMATRQVGFANKKITKSSNIQCVEKKRCKGMQLHYAALNLCIDPPCSDYYFFEFDTSSRECYLSSAFHICAIVLISWFLLSEVALTEINRYLSRKVYANIEQTHIQ